MNFLPAELIRKKRFGGSHSREELAFLVQNYSTGKIPDYQMSAWLMAVCLRGMNDDETSILTQEMRDSGTVLDLKHLGVTVDKHSTGGVGDKTSLILAPLVAAAGIPVPMIAGRGLGHTGGTLDKLEAIPGFSVQLSAEQFILQIERIGCAVMGQTPDICPADRKLYALRDVTGTVDSLPLICSSIMSKKLAAGISALVLDVKFGSGAFMRTLEDAEKLARALIGIGQNSGKLVTALLTNMNEPLGRYVGNSLEVFECLQIMEGKTFAGEGKGYHDTIELTLELAAHMIQLGGKANNLAAAKKLAMDLLANGEVHAKFLEMCKAQGGEPTEAPARAPHSQIVHATHDGFINFQDISSIGIAAIRLGAGRQQHSDKIDPSAGIEVLCRSGESVRKGAPLFIVHAESKSRIESSLHDLNSSYIIDATPPPVIPLIAKVI